MKDKILKLTGINSDRVDIVNLSSIAQSYDDYIENSEFCDITEVFEDLSTYTDKPIEEFNVAMYLGFDKDDNEYTIGVLYHNHTPILLSGNSD